MSLMKRIAVALLAVAMVLSLAACGGGDSGSGTTTTGDGGGSTDTGDSGSTAPTPASGDPVHVFIYDYSDTYIASVRGYMESAFSGAGITAEFYDGASNQGTQTQQVETALTMGASLLVVNIVTTGSEDAAMNIVEMARAQNVPLIFFNREVSDNVVNSYDKCIFVGTDADEAGYMQGEMIVDLLGGNFSDYDLNGDGVINYIMFKGELGNAEADGRTQYSVEEANRLFESAGQGGLAYYDPNNSDEFQPCNWSSAEAQAAMSTALGTNPFTGNNPIELVIANNDDMALGAIEALNEVGYNLGYDEDTGERGDHIPVVGVDATDAAQDAINSGKMDGTIKQDAEGMANAIVNLASGVTGGGSLTDNLGSYNVDAGVNKVRIPYAKFTG